MTKTAPPAKAVQEAAQEATRPAHAPYERGAGPFNIALRPAPLGAWTEPDAALADDVAAKIRLHRARPQSIFVEEPTSRAAQTEIWTLLTAHLLAEHPDRYAATAGGGVQIRAIGEDVALKPGEPPLWAAARLVQEDLLVMARSTEGRWRLVAGALAFPSSWSLREKFSRPLDEIHTTVPGFGPGARNATVIDRVFDRLQPDQLVERFNWSIYPDDRLDHPIGLDAPTDRPTKHDWRVAETPFLRIERQTLRKLPDSGAILFTVRIHLDPLARLERHPDAARLAAGLAQALAALTPPQLAYKGLVDDREAILVRLSAIAAGDQSG